MRALLTLPAFVAILLSGQPALAKRGLCNKWLAHRSVRSKSSSEFTPDFFLKGIDPNRLTFEYQLDGATIGTVVDQPPPKTFETYAEMVQFFEKQDAPKGPGPIVGLKLAVYYNDRPVANMTVQGNKSGDAAIKFVDINSTRLQYIGLAPLMYTVAAKLLYENYRAVLAGGPKETKIAWDSLREMV